LNFFNIGKDLRFTTTKQRVGVGGSRGILKIVCFFFFLFLFQHSLLLNYVLLLLNEELPVLVPLLNTKPSGSGPMNKRPGDKQGHVCIWEG
jgi:hypothetical protein